jgi:hypothetical protein
VACPHKGHRPDLGLTSFCPYTFSLVCILAFRTAKMPMIIWGPVLANEPLSAAFTSANFWHLKKPPKIKQSKAAFLQGWGREKGHPSPRPSSRCDGGGMQPRGKFIVQWCFGRSQGTQIRTFPYLSAPAEAMCQIRFISSYWLFVFGIESLLPMHFGCYCRCLQPLNFALFSTCAAPAFGDPCRYLDRLEFMILSLF